MRGIGDYSNVGNWGWEYFPPPYDFLAPRNSAPQLAPVLALPVPRLSIMPPRGRGFGGLDGCGCGCKGKGDCGSHSVAPVLAPGLGLFDSGLDWTAWSIPEWTAVGVGTYLAFSVFGDLLRGGRAVKRATRRRTSKRN